MSKKFLAVLLTMTMAFTLVACSSSEEKATEEVIEENDEVEEEVEEPLTEEDLDGILEGVEDHYVLQDAKDVDYMHGVEYSKTVDMEDDEKESASSTSKSENETKKQTKIIHSVTVDNSKVDASTPGTYKVTYTVKVNRKAYDAYKEQEATAKEDEKAEDKADETKAEDKTESAGTEEAQAEDKEEQAEAEDATAVEDEKAEEPAEDTAEDKKDSAEEEPADAEEEEEVDEADLEDVVIEKDIDIVDKEEAEKLVEEGKEVWTDESKDYGEVLEEEKKSSEGKSDSTDSAQTGETSDNKTESNDSSSDSGSNSGSSSSGSSSGSSSSGSASNSSSSSSSSKSCDHNWVATYHEATGHYESVKVQDAYDEVVGYEDTYHCNKCGYTATNANTIENHCELEGSGYYVTTSKKTVHHDAVYEQKWVQDSAAYTTYKCSKCGATK